MSQYTLLTFVGDGERSILATNRLISKKYVIRAELNAAIRSDVQELSSLEKKGVSLDDLCDFMDLLIARAFQLTDQPYFFLSAVPGSDFIVEGLRYWMARNYSGSRLLPGSKCPVRSCGKRFGIVQDVFFNPSRYPFAKGKEELYHKPLRLNRISVHLARAHLIFEKGSGTWDQCYPTSPKQFYTDFYKPWKEGKPSRYVAQFG